jgi:hypothetical protein
MVGSAGRVSVPFYKSKVQSDGLSKPLWDLFLTRSLV